MWIKRDLLKFFRSSKEQTLPIKILTGPRQVGKTSLLDQLGTHKLVLFDDLGVRKLAEENPTLFFDQFTGPLILDEATLSPQIFPELKKRVDEERRQSLKSGKKASIDIWVTGSNQTLLQKAVQESLSGRANYFSLNTLSVHEWMGAFNGEFSLESLFMRGGWPQLHTSLNLNPIQYLNDFISTFIEKDIVVAAGIEKKAAFMKALQLLSGRVGQLFNSSDIAKNIGVDTTTIQSWIALFEQNGILSVIPPFYTNLNQRLIKTPKIYFDDVGLAVRLQGWSEFEPILTSPYFGSLFENLVVSEVSKFFTNRAEKGEIYFLRSKEKVEVDLLVKLSNQRYLAIEVKTTPVDLTRRQMNLLDSLKVNIVEKWVVSMNPSNDFLNAKVVCITDLFDRLDEIH